MLPAADGNFDNITAVGKSPVNGNSLKVSGGGGVYFEGGDGTGSSMAVPAYPFGFLFDPGNSALRVGAFSQASVTNAGALSVAFGELNDVSGYASFSIGYSNNVEGGLSVAFGDSNTVEGDDAFASGSNNIVSGINAAAFGNSNAVSGYLSFGAGMGVTVNSYSSVVLGAYNKVPTASASTWVNGDPLFTIGNGTSGSQRSNALLVQKDGVVNLYPFGAASASIVLDPKGTPSITVGGQKVVTSTAAGNVGIGTTSPAANLDIASSSGDSALRIRGTTPSAEIADMFVTPSGNFVISTTAGTDADRYLDLRSADDNYGLILRDSSGANEAAWANFYMKDAAVDYLNIVVGQQSWAPGLVVTAQNRVGIGTLTPEAGLHVKGTAVVDGGTASSYHTIKGGNLESFLNFNNTAMGTGNKYWRAGIRASAGTGGSFVIDKIDDGGTSLVGTALAINGNGNVGIGTTSPGWHFVVGAGTGTEALAINGGTGNAEGAGLVILQNGVAIGSLGNAARLIGGGTSQAFRMQAQNSNNIEIVTVASNPVVLGTGNTERMRVDSTGNVGIGTSAPSAKLEVAGTVKFAKQGDIPMGEFGTNGD